jgi:hypothetical protein
MNAKVEKPGAEGGNATLDVVKLTVAAVLAVGSAVAFCLVCRRLADVGARVDRARGCRPPVPRLA